MTEKIDISKALVQTEQFVDVETMHSLKKVSEEIQQVMDVVDGYRSKVEALSPPIVNGRPWYKLDFGKASIDEVNKAMESFSTFVQETFKLVATTQQFQNENDMNICRLLGLLALAEANSYSKLTDISSEIKDLSTEDEESARQLKELEKSFLQSLDDSVLDNTKKEEQMSRLIDYVALFAESKTKKIRSISLKLSELQASLNKYCSIQDNWITETNKIISSWQKDISKNFNETSNKLEATIKRLSSQKSQQIDENFERLKSTYEKEIIKQDLKLAQNIESQNAKIEVSVKTIEKIIAEYKSVIESQTKTITSQSRSIENQNRIIASLHKRTNIALIVASIASISMISCIVTILIQ